MERPDGAGAGGTPGHARRADPSTTGGRVVGASPNGAGPGRLGPRAGALAVTSGGRTTSGCPRRAARIETAHRDRGSSGDRATWQQEAIAGARLVTAGFAPPLSTGRYGTPVDRTVLIAACRVQRSPEIPFRLSVAPSVTGRAGGRRLRSRASGRRRGRVRPGVSRGTSGVGNILHEMGGVKPAAGCRRRPADASDRRRHRPVAGADCRAPWSRPTPSASSGHRHGSCTAGTALAPLAHRRVSATPPPASSGERGRPRRPRHHDPRVTEADPDPSPTLPTLTGTGAVSLQERCRISWDSCRAGWRRGVLSQLRPPLRHG